MHILIWGTGDYSKYITDFIKREQNTINIYISGYIDNASEKWGTRFEGHHVYSPTEAKSIVDHIDYIVVSVFKHVNEIMYQCITRLGISKDKILSYRLFYTKAQYIRRYREEKCRYKSVSLEDKIAVYTANIGLYDNLQEPEFIDSTIDYFCFTDNTSYRSDIWNVKYISNNRYASPEENARLVRHYKLFPAQYLPDYKISIWVDSKYKIIGDLRKYISSYSHGSPMLSFPHFFRDCIFEEARTCIDLGRGNPDMIYDQINNYRLEKYPPHHGLYENGCIVRWQRNNQVKKIMIDWWKEINQYSVRDQISLPYVFWKNSFLPDLCDLDIEENEYLVKIGHRDYDDKPLKR